MAVGPLLTLTLGVTLSLLTTAHCGVFVVAPNILNANENVTVSVLVRQGLSSPDVTVTIQSNGRIHDSVTKTVTRDRQEKFEVRVNGSKLGDPDPNGQYYVQLRVQCTGCGNFDRTTDILVNKRTGTVFLQTDKPIYSPGQTVTIQVFALTEKRKAASIPIKVEIKNTNGVNILRKLGSTRTGLFTDDFKIPSLPVYGMWKIAVHFGVNFTESREKQIEIKKYVLPHFQVRLTNYPSYIKSLTQSIEGNIEAKYSFAVNVVGKARLVFRVVTHGVATYLTYKHIVLSYGRAKFMLDADDMATLNMTDLLNSGSHLQTEIIVTETSTGIKESIIAPKCHFVNSPYIISFNETMAYFIPGLPFQVKITVRNIQDQSVPNAKLEISTTDQRNQRVGVSSKVTSERKTNDDGVISYYFDMIPQITELRVEVNVEGDPQKTEHVIHRADMPGYMKISPHNVRTRALQPGSATVFEALFTDSKNLERLQFMLVSGGRIFSVGHKVQPDMTAFTFRRHISYDNTPSVRIVAWYFRNDTNELVAASSKLQVERKCKTQAEVQPAESCKKILNPKDKCKMVYKGTIGAKVITMAVDKAVYFMKNGSRLTQKSFFDEFETRDLGCAVGGGANATDVFALAGLTILSNTFSHPRRNSVNCAHTASSSGRRKRSTESQDPDDETCCNAGERFANTSQIILSNHQRHTVCFTAAASYTSRSCKNSFGRCCVKRATARANDDQDHSRTESSEEDMVNDMLKDEATVTPRTDFPESWHLSSNLEIKSEGKVEKEVEMPDSITTWVFQAVTMSTTEGMCVAKPYKQVVRKDVFVKLHLPHSAVLGEQMELAATVYNSRDNVLLYLLVKLLGVEGLCTDAVPGEYSEQVHRNLEGWSSWTARWPIVPMKIGEIEITVKLLSIAGWDVVTRYLTVVPSGDLVVAPILPITQDPSARLSSQQSWNGTVGSLNYTVTRNSRKREQIMRVPLRLPQDSLPKMAIMKVTLLGDIMAPLIEDFSKGAEKKLIRPGGCGSQTMATLGPLIFATRYLKHKGKLNGELKEKAKKHITAGVNHMKGYQKQDGGFAVYNKPSRKSTVWLTAFAVKTFSQVRTSEVMANDTLIDNDMMDNAVNWLLQQRDDSGFFRSVTIHYRTRYTLAATAYVYIALLDAGYYDKHKADIDKALNRLSQKAVTETDPFVLAIVTYALARYSRPERSSINQRLLDRATIITDTYAQPMLMSWSQNTHYRSALDVETAGYALLAQVALGRITESVPIVEWLVSQRYGGSLFGTTQSTVVALQALVEYGLRSQPDELDMTCTMTFPDVPNRRTHNFILNDANKLVQHREEVSDHIGKLMTIVCKGTGLAHTAVETAYYTTKSQAENCAFNISAQAIPKDGKKMTIKVCSSVKAAYQNLSMPMLEVGIGTGFTPVNKTLEKLEENMLIDLYEVNNRTVVLYVKEIPSDKELCLSFDVERQQEVKNVRPVPVKVYAYYEPDMTNCRTFYDPLGNKTGMLDIKCDPSHGWCKCLENECPRCYGYRSVDQSAAETLPNKTALKKLACDKPYINYVFAGTVEGVENRNGEVRFTIYIDTVAKQGTESRSLVENNMRIFTYPTKCMSCLLDRGRRYVIMGEDGNEKDGVMEYLISHNTYIVPLYPKNGKVWYKGRKGNCEEFYNSSECERLTEKPKGQDKKLNNEHKRFLGNLRKKTCGT